jgi:hypothetical protein
VKLTGSEHAKQAAAHKRPAQGRAHGKAKGHAKATHVPPGQAKQGTHVPPGQAKKAQAKRPEHVPRGKAKGHAKSHGRHGKP